MKLLHAGPAPLWAAIAGVAITGALVAGSFERIAKVFKWLCLVLLVYVGVLFAAHVKWGDVARGLLLLKFQLSPTYLGLVVTLLGTTISPYMFFWQSAQRAEGMRAEELGGDAAPALNDRTRSAAKRKTLNGPNRGFHGHDLLRADHVRHHCRYRRDARRAWQDGQQRS